MTGTSKSPLRSYEDVDHATLMRERMVIEGWTQQMLVDRSGLYPGSSPYIHISKMGRRPKGSS